MNQVSPEIENGVILAVTNALYRTVILVDVSRETLIVFICTLTKKERGKKKNQAGTWYLVVGLFVRMMNVSRETSLLFHCEVDNLEIFTDVVSEHALNSVLQCHLGHHAACTCSS